MNKRNEAIAKRIWEKHRSRMPASVAQFDTGWDGMSWVEEGQTDWREEWRALPAKVEALIDEGMHDDIGGISEFAYEAMLVCMAIAYLEGAHAGSGKSA